MEIKRDSYLEQLISFSWDGQIKVITGIRRCGKSYLLNKIFKDYLTSHGAVSYTHLDVYKRQVCDIVRQRL